MTLPRPKGFLYQRPYRTVDAGGRRPSTQTESGRGGRASAVVELPGGGLGQWVGRTRAAAHTKQFVSQGPLVASGGTAPYVTQ